METVWTITGSLLSGVVASAIFLAILYSLRPSVEVSPRIAVTQRDGKDAYCIKFVNTGRRDIVDIHFELWVARLENAPGGRYTHREKKILQAQIHHLPRYRHNDENARYAYWVWGFNNILELWSSDDDRYLLLTLSAKDEISGFSRAVRVEFTSRSDCLVHGKHRTGRSLEVVPAIAATLPLGSPGQSLGSPQG